MFLLQEFGSEEEQYSQQTSAATGNRIGVVRCHMLCGDELDVRTDSLYLVGWEEYMAAAMVETEEQEEEGEQEVDADT